MIVKIIAVGKLKERYWQEGAADYLQRLQPYARMEIIEVLESKIANGLSPALKEKALSKEAESIMKKLSKERNPLVVLDKRGKEMDSQEMADFIAGHIVKGSKSISWVIGGPLGLAPSILQKADFVISFSKLTFPHQMIRLILLEQIYRSYRIICGQPYHK